jgi:hypothetical protein
LAGDNCFTFFFHDDNDGGKIPPTLTVWMHLPFSLEDSMARSSAQKKVISSEPEALPADKTAEMHERIAALAYLKAEARGFFPGQELDDWLEAEQEINGARSIGRKH